MAKPVGVGRATKDNSKKHPQQSEEFTEGKKIGRPKQVWVWDATPLLEIGEEGVGHWEKIKA